MEAKLTEIMDSYNEEIETSYFDGLDRVQAMFDEKVNKIKELNTKFEDAKCKHDNDVLLSIKTFYLIAYIYN